jgi:hypothetical protein
MKLKLLTAVAATVRYLPSQLYQLLKKTWLDHGKLTTRTLVKL